MTPILKVKRIELGIKNLKIYQMISLGLVIFSSISFIFIDEYNVVVTFIFISLVFFLFFKVQDLDNVIFYDNQVHHVYFGKIKKIIHYQDIIELIGIESSRDISTMDDENINNKEEPLEYLGYNIQYFAKKSYKQLIINKISC